jgi:hypothetical protein
MQGKDAKEPYRVRAGRAWYFVDPTFPADAIEPGDTVVVYPVAGDAVVAILRGRPSPATVIFSTPQGERFDVAASDIAALHLATLDIEP